MTFIYPPSSLRPFLIRTTVGFTLSIVLACLPSPARAQEPYVTFPLLPVGYSSIKVFDNQGRYAGRILPEQRYWVTIDRIPQFLQKAVVAVEDARFYEHGGIDVRGIARAVVKDVVKRRLAEGGSTITQQLIKNRYLTGEKSIDRKVNEALMAIEFEKKYSKRQILEMYFNEIYYGNGAWGIAQAARIYFDKSPEELTDGECALLAGVQKNPGRYNPLGKPEEVTRRRDVVLKRMVDLEMITPRQQQQLRANPPAVVQPAQGQQYLAHLRAKLIERFGPAAIELGGLEVTAAMDLKLQKLAEQVLTEGARKINPQMQGALICLDPVTGDILAAVGGTDYPKSQYNRAFTAKRQPGSSIKPLIYAAALERGITAGSIWNDAPLTYDRGGAEPWQPRNYDGRNHGEMSLRQALTTSNNIIAVKLLEAVTLPSFTDAALRMGLTLRGSDLSLALGTEEVTLHDLTSAYAPFANGGIRPEPRSIIRIYDRVHRTWIETPSTPTQALTPGAAYIVTSMLKDVLTSGTAKGLKRFAGERPMAGKTGTTSDYRDAWFVGYTPRMVTGVWLGYDKPRPGGKGFTGGGVAAPIWERFMRQALTGRPVVDFERPESVETIAIDPKSGCPAEPGTATRDELYIAGFEPTEECNQGNSEDESMKDEL